MSAFVALVGKKFGRLLVRRRARNSSGGRACWWCTCECGNKVKVSGKDLRGGHTKSCGCIQKEKAGLERRVPGVAARQLFLKTIGRAKRKGLKFSLTFEQFLDLSTKPCVYCGRDFSSTNRQKYEEFKYNGLDRVDSKKDYTADNVVPCCKFCNIMKSDISVEEFQDQVERIYAVNLLKTNATLSRCCK